MMRLRQKGNFMKYLVVGKKRQGNEQHAGEANRSTNSMVHASYQQNI